ncbi:hypothetical protein EV359DRAFT_61873 [Lentinula novae-zelandiae]|nr:hypothetical protein EV359DRAFT_61873 [Lentinula novae-zelandiae]
MIAARSQRFLSAPYSLGVVPGSNLRSQMGMNGGLCGPEQRADLAQLPVVQISYGPRRAADFKSSHGAAAPPRGSSVDARGRRGAFFCRVLCRGGVVVVCGSSWLGGCGRLLAMRQLANLFPFLKSLRLNLDVVDVMAPREFQLQSIGFLRYFSPADELNNMDPDFVALERAFETGAAFGGVSSGAPGGGQLGGAREEGGAVSSESSDEDAPLNPAGSRKRKAKVCLPEETPPGSRTHHARDPGAPRPGVFPPHRHTVEDSALFQCSLTTVLPPSDPQDPPTCPPEWKQMRKHQLRKWSLARKAKKSTEVHSTKPLFDIKADSCISKPAWMGLRVSLDLRKPIEEAVGNPGSEISVGLFGDLTRAPYLPHLALAIADSLGLLFLYRSRLTPAMMTDLLPKVNSLVPEFVSSIARPFSENDMLSNSRGDHWFSIAGHDRNNKSEPAATQFQRQNHSAIVRFFAKGSVLERLTAYGCGILKAHFPAIGKRYQDSVDYMLSKYGIQAMFGLFFNFCLNSPREGHFNHHEKCWLVIWEAGIVLELPPGVFLFYPSSLFLHFNLDITDLPVVTTPHGETPTKENSKPLFFCGCKSHNDNLDWAEANGRGSMVWFNQASMMQTSELGVPTIEQARRLGMDTICDREVWFTRGVFPSVT